MKEKPGSKKPKIEQPYAIQAATPKLLSTSFEYCSLPSWYIKHGISYLIQLLTEKHVLWELELPALVTPSREKAYNSSEIMYWVKPVSEK